MAWESHHNIHSLSEQRLILLNHCHHHNFTFFFLQTELSRQTRHEFLNGDAFAFKLVHPHSPRWEKHEEFGVCGDFFMTEKKWKHHNHKENNKQTKTWKVTPEEDENDDTFTGWVSSCENSSSDHLWRTSSYFCVSTEISQQQLMILFLTWQVATLRSASHSSFSSRAVIHSLLVLVFATSVSCFAFDQLVDLWWVTHRFLITNVTINRIMSYYPECCVHVKFTRW